MNIQEKQAYLTASKEADSQDRDEAIWIKALSITQGDEDKSKHEYVRLRVNELIQDGHSSATSSERMDDVKGLLRGILNEQNRRWLYFLVVFASVVSGLTVLMDDPEDSYSLFFTIGALIVGFRFLAQGKRVRFTVCLILACLLNPIFIDENQYDEEMCYVVSVVCTSVLLLLHCRYHHYTYFRNAVIVISTCLVCINAFLFIDNEIRGDEAVGISVVVLALSYYVLIPLFKHTVFRDPLAEKDHLSDLEYEELKPHGAWKTYLVSLFIALAFAVPARLVGVDLTSSVDTTPALLITVAGLASLVCSLTMVVAFGCSIVRVTQALYRLSWKHAVAAKSWFLIPLLHFLITAILVYANHLMVEREMRQMIMPSSNDSVEMQLVTSELESLYGASNAKHLEKWNDSELADLFGRHLDKSEIDAALFSCMKMEFYLVDQDSENLKLMGEAERIVRSSRISDIEKAAILREWGEAGLAGFLSDLTIIELRAVSVIREMLVHLNQNEWAYDDGQYVFADRGSMIAYEGFVESLSRVYSEEQELKSKFLLGFSEWEASVDE